LWSLYHSLVCFVVGVLQLLGGPISDVWVANVLSEISGDVCLLAFMDDVLVVSIAFLMSNLFVLTFEHMKSWGLLLIFPIN
ncbi:hypothetical protein BpHYR1_001426, partial [Brachionus plicatilis]